MVIIMEGRHQRIKKTTAEQYQYMINFLGEHKVMLKGKLSPAESLKVGELWVELTKALNNLKGSTKPLQQWKRTFIEYKSKVKSKSRSIQNKIKGTGGGPPETGLNEVESLCLNLIGKITTEGDPVTPEVGIPQCNGGVGAFASACCEEEFTSADEIITMVIENTDPCSPQLEADDTSIEAPILKTAAPKRGKKCRVTNTPLSRTRLQDLTNANENICESLTLLSNSINKLAESNNGLVNLSASLNNLADAIKLVAQRNQ